MNNMIIIIHLRIERERTKIRIILLKKIRRHGMTSIMAGEWNVSDFKCNDDYSKSCGNWDLK